MISKARLRVEPKQSIPKYVSSFSSSSNLSRKEARQWHPLHMSMVATVGMQLLSMVGYLETWSNDIVRST
jgi:hypothetical protein